MIPKQFLTHALQACKHLNITLDQVTRRTDVHGSVIGTHNGSFVFSYHPDRPSSFSYSHKWKKVEHYTKNPFAVYREAAANTRKILRVR